MSEDPKPWILEPSGKAHRDDVMPTCPVCGAKCNGATGIGKSRMPEPGDLSVCVRCTSYLTFTQDGLEVLSPERYRVDFSPEQKAFIARSADGLVKGPAAQSDKGKLQRLIIPRGDTYRAAVRYPGGLFVVSAAVSRRKDATRLLRDTTGELLIQDGTAEVQGVFYAAARLLLWGQRHLLDPLGPFATEEAALAARPEVLKAAVEALGGRVHFTVGKGPFS